MACLSWISPSNRHQLMSTIARRLKPGGLAYLGYNVTAGWASMVPVRSLMRMLTAASPERTDLAVPAMLDYIDRLKQAGAALFPGQPGHRGAPGRTSASRTRATSRTNT